MQAVRSNYLAISLTVDAPIQSVWDALADWEKQGDWMIATRVWVTSSIQEGVGAQISAFTGIKSLGLLDTMEVTSWVPPFVCDVVHTGSIIKGVGKFELHEISPMQTRLDWSEEVLAPRPLFLVIFPGLYVGVRISLGRFARSLR